MLKAYIYTPIEVMYRKLSVWSMYSRMRPMKYLSMLIIACLLSLCSCRSYLVTLNSMFVSAENDLSILTACSNVAVSNSVGSNMHSSNIIVANLVSAVRDTSNNLYLLQHEPKLAIIENVVLTLTRDPSNTSIITGSYMEGYFPRTFVFVM